MIDENDFFRQATLHICGNLDIDRAMQNCLLYLRNYIPAEWMSLHLYDRRHGMMRTIALVTPSEINQIDQFTPLPPDARETLAKKPLPPFRIFNRSDNDPVSKVMSHVFGHHHSSNIRMHLSIKEREFGALAVGTEGYDRYTEEHGRLLALLNEPFAIAMANAMRHRKVLELKDMLTDDNRYLHKELLRLSGDKIIGAEGGLKGVMAMVRKVAPLTSPVLLLGETGVGKELIAGAIHHASPRKDRPFITVNSGAIPETLLDSELFGHEKGAFTGAIAQKRGRFERAHGGTIFLDEIGELTPQAQIRMLRVLQEHEIERVGGSKSIHVDIRIIAATHRDLDSMIRSGKFREDFLFRLNVFPVIIPPLRERKHDIPALTHYFITRKSIELGLRRKPQIAPGAIDRLKAYRWPGNVRELENVIERALILNPGGMLHFEGFKQSNDPGETSDGGVQESVLQSLDQVNADHIRLALKVSKGKVHGNGGAANLLGINPSTLRNRMNRLGISYGRGTEP